MTEHPITPPPELMQQWANAWHTGTCTQELLEYIATQAARWGFEQAINAIQIPTSGPDPLFIAGMQEAKNQLMTLSTTTSAYN